MNTKKNRIGATMAKMLEPWFKSTVPICQTHCAIERLIIYIATFAKLRIIRIAILSESIIKKIFITICRSCYVEIKRPFFIFAFFCQHVCKFGVRKENLRVPLMAQDCLQLPKHVLRVLLQPIGEVELS